MVKSQATTVDDYLASLPDDRREVVAAVLEVIRKNIPSGYSEGMNWGMIAFEIPLSRYPKPITNNLSSTLPWAPRKTTSPSISPASTWMASVRNTCVRSSKNRERS